MLDIVGEVDADATAEFCPTHAAVLLRIGDAARHPGHREEAHEQYAREKLSRRKPRRKHRLR